ncbi:hypothetical protein N0V88_006892 [Collariella sp. IMI 366227]|nr:hypothetical protein N0V88_006892 [Collariella sp. IMI 366227]
MANGIQAPSDALHADPSNHKRKRVVSPMRQANNDRNPQTAVNGVTAPDLQLRLIFLHINALLTDNNAVSSTLRKALVETVPNVTLPESNTPIYSALASSALMADILTHLGIRPLTRDESAYLKKAYIRIYMSEALGQLTLADGAKEFLDEVKKQGGMEVLLMSHQLAIIDQVINKLGVRELVGLDEVELIEENGEEGDGETQTVEGQMEGMRGDGEVEMADM